MNLRSFNPMRSWCNAKKGSGQIYCGKLTAMFDNQWGVGWCHSPGKRCQSLPHQLPLMSTGAGNLSASLSSILTSQSVINLHLSPSLVMCRCRLHRCHPVLPGEGGRCDPWSRHRLQRRQPVPQVRQHVLQVSDLYCRCDYCTASGSLEHAPSEISWMDGQISKGWSCFLYKPVWVGVSDLPLAVC